MKKSDGTVLFTGMPEHDDEPVFREPWEAHAFALAVTLHETGLFTWTEWAEYLSAELHNSNALEDGSDYYVHWLSALQKLLVSRQVTATDTVDQLATAWQRAAHATPHGQPVVLENDPQLNGDT